MNKPYRLLLISILALIVAACSGSSDDSSTDVLATEIPTTAVTPANTDPTPQVQSTEEDVATDTTSNTDYPTWYTAELTNVSTGETFTLADFQGQTVFVESMATWCTNCRRQLQNVRAARESAGSSDYVFVALSLETNLSNGELAAYMEREGFDWTFAVMSADMLRAFVDQFGRSISSAPSTPHFIIRPDGSFTDLVTGIESADQLLAQLSDANGM